MIVHPTTGEIYAKTDSLEDLSEARRTLLLAQKELEQLVKTVDEKLRPHIDELAEAGEKELGGFWQIVNGSKRFVKKEFDENATAEEKARFEALQEEIKDIQEPYKRQGSSYLKFPKF